MGKENLHPGGASFSESLHFSEENKKLLEQHYSRIMGTLKFWKNQANKYGHFHTYCLIWITISAILIPVITQFVGDGPYSKLVLTVISLYTTILLSLHRAFKIENHYKAYRKGESEFYDLYRRLLDRPSVFGNDEPKQLETYFIEVEKIRKIIRDSEIDHFPTLEDIKMH